MFLLQVRIQIEVPVGEITATGIAEIARFIDSQDVTTGEWQRLNPAMRFSKVPMPMDWEWVWKIERGEYTGTFPKRFGRWLHRHHRINAPVKFLEELGNLARRHTVEATGYTFDFTRRFDWQDGDFGDDGSCFWGSRSGARKMLAENGAYAIRFYEDGEGIGRAWIAEIERDFYIVFNGYGFPDATMTIARVLSFYLNMAYRSIELSNWGNHDGTLWINGGRGVAVGPWGSIHDLTDFDLQWEIIDDDDYDKWD